MENRFSSDSMLMHVAEIVALRATCSRAQVGCVIAKDNRIISMGYNGAPKGMTHCNHDHDSSSGCDVSVHAEANAIAFAAKEGIATEGATLYTTLSPCKTCAQLIINAGITTVHYTKLYRDESGINLLRLVNINTYFGA